jgi:predicted glycosyltransferase
LNFSSAGRYALVADSLSAKSRHTSLRQVTVRERQRAPLLKIKWRSLTLAYCSKAMSNRKKLMFYCQHVLGMGHFIRSAAIVRGLVGSFDVCFLNGGEMIPGFDLPPEIEVINLPPIKADAQFRDIHAVGSSADLDEIKSVRRRRILDEYRRLEPHVLMIELYPFGRLKFGFELMPLLECAKSAGSQTKVVCSLRDILVSKREQQRFEEDACRIVSRYFDLLLVHSDPRFQLLEETFPKVSELKCPIRYTGFVTQRLPHDLSPAGGGEKSIVVSIGGGRVGIELIDCAIEAGRLIADELPHEMLIFTGPYLPESEFQRLQAKIAGRSNVKIQRYTTKFTSDLQKAELSISMAGYNTCLNILTTGVPAIVYPFIGNNNREQAIRANKLFELGLVEVIYPHELTPQLLAEKIMLTLSKPRRAMRAPAFDLNGVANTARALIELVSNR